MTKELIKNAKYILQICEKLKESILFGKYELENILLSCYHLSELAEMHEIKNWIKNELEGYNREKEDIEKLPKYRKKVFCKLDKDSIDQKKVEVKPMYLPFTISTPRIIKFLEQEEEQIVFVLNKEWEKIINEEFGLKLSNESHYSIVFLKNNFIGILESVKMEIMSNINKLESYANKIFEENVEIEDVKVYDPKKIFVVHGRHEKSRMELADILKNRLHLEPIVLMDQSNGGKILIEKFENHSLNVGFVFVILTPDDVAMLKEDYLKIQSDLTKIKDMIEEQVRPNVLLELGYFIGKLGRSRVCCIQQGEKELVPSDLHGLVTIRFQNTIKEIYLDIEAELKKVSYLSDAII